MKISIMMDSLVATASQTKIDSINAKLERLAGKLELRKKRAKAASVKGSPAVKALAKAKKAGGRIPADVRSAAKAAQTLIDATAEHVERTANRIAELKERVATLKAAAKKAPAKTAVKKPVAKTKAAPAKKGAVKRPAAEVKKVAVKPIKGKVRRPGVEDDDDAPPKKTKKAAPAPVTKTPKVKPASVPKSPPPETGDGAPSSITPEDRAMQKKIGNAALFKAAAKSKTAQLEYLRKTWDVANEKLFGGKMKRPTLGLMKKVAVTAFRTSGRYFPRQNKIDISPNLFGGDEAFAVTTIAHEMAHQAVYELDGVSRLARLPDNGHTAEWRRHMVKIGLTPARFSTYSKLELMDKETKAKELERRENFKSAIEEGQVMPRFKMKAGTHAIMLDKRPNNQYARLPGVIIDASGARNVRMFINGPRGRHGLMVVPPQIIMEPTSLEAAEMNRQKDYYADMLAAATRKNDLINEARKQRRESKKRARSMFGGYF